MDNDGWEDLYLVIDRNLWSNKIFHNNHDGTFTSISDTSGATPAMDAMCCSAGDYDNDGDLDIYVTNGWPGNRLFRNDGGVFTDVTAGAGVAVNLICWGSLWLDYNNDSWQDLFVGTTGSFFGAAQNRFFINQNEPAFLNGNVITNIEGDTSATFVNAKGDFNNDGYFDFVTNNNDPMPSKIWLNNGGDNHFLSVRLEGVISNKSGIGNWIHVYVNDEHFVRYTISGDNFNSQNASREIFGLGELTFVDSLVIQWNSGTRDVYHNVNTNQNLHLVEGASFIVPFAIQPSSALVLCPGDSLLLNAGSYNSYLWNTGDTSQFISATSSGDYFVEVINGFGSWMTSDVLSVSDAEIPELQTITSPIVCHGEQSGSIQVHPIQQSIWSFFEWEGSEAGFLLDSIGAGSFHFHAQTLDGCWTDGNISISEPDPLSFNIETSDVRCATGNDGSAIVVASGGTGEITYLWNELDFDSLTADEYAISVIDESGCMMDSSFVIFEPLPFAVTAIATPQHENELDGNIQFELLGGTFPYSLENEIIVSNEYLLDEMPGGNYSFSFSDAMGCEYTLNVNIPIIAGLSERVTDRIHFYPNPVDQVIYASETIVSCKVLDVTGSLVGTLHFVNGGANVLDFAGGIYCIQFVCVDGSSGFAVIVIE